MIWITDTSNFASLIYTSSLYLCLLMYTPRKGDKSIAIGKKTSILQTWETTRHLKLYGLVLCNLRQRSLFLQSDTFWCDMAHCLEYSERVAQVQFFCPGLLQSCMSSWQRMTNPFLEILQDGDTRLRSWEQILAWGENKEGPLQRMQWIVA